MRPPAIHHVGYVVDDIPAAAARFAGTFGAGPCHLIEHLAFDEVTFDGGPAAYDHSSAFGQWGPIIVELTQVHAVEPAGLRAALAAGPMPRVGHVAWLADDLTAESRRLVATGLELFHTGRSGPVRAHWFDARQTLGHHVEVLQATPELIGFYDLIARTAQDWDGREILRM
jgi:catechol 2,3-dioxygenase-like lactoylglutathione lyase family enzyme